MPVAVRGLRDLSRAFKHADREVRLGWRRGLRGVAEPIRRDAEGLARTEISGMARSLGAWSGMRIGVTQRVVYVAPKQRGVKVRGADPRKRPRFAALLMEKAMEPALHEHEGQIERATEELLDRMANDFNRGGGL